MKRKIRVKATSHRANCHTCWSFCSATERNEQHPTIIWGREKWPTVVGGQAGWEESESNEIRTVRGKCKMKINPFTYLLKLSTVRFQKQTNTCQCVSGIYLSTVSVKLFIELSWLWWCAGWRLPHCCLHKTIFTGFWRSTIANHQESSISAIDL